MQRALVLRFGAVCLCAAVFSACSKTKSLADQLSPSGVTVSALTLSFNTPAVGGTVQATASATFSNGSTSAVASGFGTDTPSVATVSGSGSVTGVAIGDVTIFVDYQGTRATKRVRVLPGYGGTFVGTYAIASCAATGGFVSADPEENFCTDFTIGRVLPIAVQNTQSADLTTMTGLFQLGGLVGNGSGTVAPAGALAYGGFVVVGTTRVELRNFTATSPTPGRIAGSFDMFWTDTTTTGSGTLTCINMDMTRQGATLGPPVGLLVARSSPGRPAMVAKALLGLR